MKDFNIKYYLTKVQQNNITSEEEEMLLNLIEKHPEVLTTYFEELYPFIIKIENKKNFNYYKKKDELKKIPQKVISEYEELMIKYYERIITKEEERKLNDILKDPIFRKEFHLYGKVYLKPNEDIKFNSKIQLYRTINKTSNLLYVSLSIAASFVIFMYILFTKDSNNYGKYLQEKEINKISINFKKTYITPNNFVVVKNSFKVTYKNNYSVHKYSEEYESEKNIEETKNIEILTSENKTEQPGFIPYDTLTPIAEEIPVNKLQNSIEVINNNIGKRNNSTEISLKTLLLRSLKNFLKNKTNIDIRIVNETHQKHSIKGIIINDFEFIASRRI